MDEQSPRSGRRGPPCRGRAELVEGGGRTGRERSPCKERKRFREKEREEEQEGEGEQVVVLSEEDQEDEGEGEEVSSGYVQRHRIGPLSKDSEAVFEEGPEEDKAPEKEEEGVQSVLQEQQKPGQWRTPWWKS